MSVHERVTTKFKCWDSLYNWHSQEYQRPILKDPDLYERVSSLLKLPYKEVSESACVDLYKEVHGVKPAPTGNTIWYHGKRSYSMHGNAPINVSVTEHSVLQAFLEADAALDTAMLKKTSATNPSTTMQGLEKKFPGAIRRPRPRKKNDGYFARVKPK